MFLFYTNEIKRVRDISMFLHNGKSSSVAKHITLLLLSQLSGH